MEYTGEQQHVIDIRGTNALVSAAAGSGKTAVIVERLIQRVIKDGIDIDQILLVTFTKAAAGEMKERIRAAFEKKLDDTDPGSPSFRHIEKQFSLLYSAPITTIDSFCLDVIKNNFDVISLDPSFRVADEGEIAMIRADVMDELMERHYSVKEDEIGFYDFLERFSVKRNDDDITDAIVKIHDFAVSRPNPENFIASTTSVYEAESAEDLNKNGLFLTAHSLVRDKLLRIMEAMKRACDLAMSPGGPKAYQASFEDDISMLKDLADTDSFLTLFERFSSASFSRLPTKKSPDEDKDIREEAKALRAKAKYVFDNMKKSLFDGSIDDILEELKTGRKDIEVLSALALEYYSDYNSEKKKRSLMDFADLEHTALKILKDEAVQKRYREHFKEIMVDEYQDCNRIQEEIFKSVSNGNNLFCVGDVKQSIYSFRDACPDLFIDKYRDYEKEKGGRLLLLSKNFRSRKSILDATNVIFRNVMHASVGGVEYDKNAFLNYSHTYTHDNPGDMTEYLLTEYDHDSGLLQQETEALSIAKRIKELVGNYEIEDRKAGTVRKCGYKDIVILMRAMNGYDSEYARILGDNGIPVSLDNRSGYLFSDEIRTLIAFLNVIDNPYQDIPLAGTLLSVFGGFDESGLALIRSACPETGLYKAVVSAAENGDEKACGFLKKLEDYRHAASYLSMFELLSLIIKDHDYDNIVRAGNDGQIRLANLNMLLYRASEFEKTSFKGLFRFIRYIEYMKKYEIDLKGPSGEDSERDAVRIMSIHHSKGLEFPVVFVCGLYRQYNMMDLRERIITDDLFGAGADIIDVIRRTKKKTFIKKLIAFRKENSIRGEELRILYVAMTRAEQKLILSAMEAKDDFGNGLGRSKKEMPASVDDAGSYSTLIDLAFSMDDEVENFIKKDIRTTEELTLNVFDEAEDAMFQKKDFILKAENYEGDEDREIRKCFRTDPSSKALSAVPEKLSVSYIKHEAMEEAGVAIAALAPEKTVPVPRFYLGEGQDGGQANNGALKGTAYHALFEHLDFERMSDAEDVKKQIDDLVSSGILDEKDKGMINAEDIVDFARSDLADRMQKAGREGNLYRERPFVILVNADEIDPSYPSDETVMVQGIIDAYFIEDGKAVIMDYKTDKVRDGGELVKKYKAQLDFYARAIRQLTGMEIAGEIIYSVTLGEEIVII